MENRKEDHLVLYADEDLRNILRDAGLESTGSKSELIQRVITPNSEL